MFAFLSDSPLGSKDALAPKKVNYQVASVRAAMEELVKLFKKAKIQVLLV